MAIYEPSYMVNAVRAPVSYGYGRRVPAVELLVPMCCTKCQEKIRENMLELDGVQGVIADLRAQRVTVTGFVDPMKALRKAKKVKKDSQLWTSGAAPAPYIGHGEHLMSSRKKYHRSEYRPSLYRPMASTYESARPPVYRASSFELHPRPSVYRTSYNQYTPSSYGHSYIHRPRPLYTENPYSHVISNPHYFKHIESEYY